LPQAPRQPLTLETLCFEAVALFGDDWRSIEQYVDNRLSGLPAATRRAVLQDVSAILNYRAPLHAAG